MGYQSGTGCCETLVIYYCMGCMQKQVISRKLNCTFLPVTTERSFVLLSVIF